VRVAFEPAPPSGWPRTRAVSGVGSRAAAIDNLFARLTAVALTVLVASDVFGGAVRFGLGVLGVPFLSYAPTLFSAGLAVAYFTYRAGVSRLDPRIFALLGFFAAYSVYSLLIGVVSRVTPGPAGVGRVAFALYTWTPFFLGLALVSQGEETLLVRHAVLWWALAIVGVVVNRFVHFPWTGSTLEVLGQETQVARDWSTNGLERLAGFSRASYTVANEITVFGVLLVALPGVRRPLRALAWVVSTAAVALTTAKTPLMALLFVPPALWIQKAVPRATGQRPGGQFRLAMATLVAMLAALVMLPVSPATPDLLLRYSFGNVGFLTLTSMLDRTATMWPSAFALIADDHNWIEWVLGRGLGGIGSAQTLFEPLDANSADNMFVFLYVTFGVSCIVFGLSIFSRFRAIYRDNDGRFAVFFALAGCVLMLGVATNVIESIVPAIALGILAGKSSRNDLGFQPLERDIVPLASRM
jgi:hypothetical protein